MSHGKKTVIDTVKGTAEVSRRQLLRGTAIAAGGATLLAVTLSTTAARAQAAKISQADAAYQGTAKGEQSCANCSLFVAPSSCGVVEGTISPTGWCKLYQKK